MKTTTNNQTTMDSYLTLKIKNHKQSNASASMSDARLEPMAAAGNKTPCTLAPACIPTYKQQKWPQTIKQSSFPLEGEGGACPEYARRDGGLTPVKCQPLLSFRPEHSGEEIFASFPERHYRVARKRRSPPSL